jgi:hypothetical protein
MRGAVHPDDLARHEGKWRAPVASGEPHESEVRFRRADGHYRWHLDRGVPLRDADGNIIKWYGVVTDIEDRKRVGDAFRRNEMYVTESVHSINVELERPGPAITAVRHALVAFAERNDLSNFEGCMGLNAICEFGQRDADKTRIMRHAGRAQRQALNAYPRSGKKPGSAESRC